jgi:hypothetical protein
MEEGMEEGMEEEGMEMKWRCDGRFFFPHRRLFVLGLNALVFFRRTVAVYLPNLLDNKEVFLHACATVAFALRAVADAVRTRTEKLPYYRVHSVYSSRVCSADCRLGAFF